MEVTGTMRHGTGPGGAFTRTRCSACRVDGAQLAIELVRSRIDLGAIASGSCPTRLRVLPYSSRTCGAVISDDFPKHRQVVRRAAVSLSRGWPALTTRCGGGHRGAAA